ncbi:hypothetical protein F5883DRAFT_584699 [Diaporthe sp. PMI_573]|nr:hypothetical protein F5883DRAFT_584699 [Diaporthaceae sp. PMI_573]
MLSPRTARQLFVATVAPTMDYASSVWAHSCPLLYCHRSRFKNCMGFAREPLGTTMVVGYRLENLYSDFQQNLLSILHKIYSQAAQYEMLGDLDLDPLEHRRGFSNRPFWFYWPPRRGHNRIVPGHLRK